MAGEKTHRPTTLFHRFSVLPYRKMQQTRRVSASKMSTCNIWNDRNHRMCFLELPAIITEKPLFREDINMLTDRRNNREWKHKAIDQVREKACLTMLKNTLWSLFFTKECNLGFYRLVSPSSTCVEHRSKTGSGEVNALGAVVVCSPWRCSRLVITHWCCWSRWHCWPMTSSSTPSVNSWGERRSSNSCFSCKSLNDIKSTFLLSGLYEISIFIT